MAHYIDSFPGRKIVIEGTAYLYFGGTAYLGLQTDTEFQEIYIHNVKRYGTSYGASRKSNVRLSIYNETEEYLANMVGSEACITLSSGYLAGQLVSKFFDAEAYRSFYAPNSHSALFTSKTKQYTTFTTLNIALREHLASRHAEIPVVFMDAIDFSGSNYPDFEGLKWLPLEDIILVVDDSHGIGVVGENGTGVYRILQKLRPKELVVCCSLGKGFGIQAGAIFGTATRISNLTKTDFFGGASPAAPANVATLIAADAIYSEKRSVLQKNITLFRDCLNDISQFRYMENYPTYCFGDPQRTRFLEKHQIIITDFSYPDEDTARVNRIVLSAAHLEDDILRLTAVLNQYEVQPGHI